MRNLEHAAKDLNPKNPLYEKVKMTQKKRLQSLSLSSPLAHLIVIAPNLHQERLQTHNATTT